MSGQLHKFLDFFAKAYAEAVAQRCSVKFTGKHLCQSPFFNKATGLRPHNNAKNMTHPHAHFFNSANIVFI